VAAGSVVMVASRVAVLGCGLVLMGYLTRKLGLEDYGRYAFSLLLVNWIGVSIGLATGGALVRLVAGRADGHRFAVSMLQLVALVSCGLGLLLFAGAGWLAAAVRSPEIADLLRVLAIDLPLGGMAGVHLGILTARGEFLKNAIGILAGWILQLGAAVVFLEGGAGLRGAGWAVVAGGAGQLALARAMSGVEMISRERVGFSELWGETRLMAGAQLALRVSQSMDLVAVKYFLLSPAFAGLYAGVQNIGFAAMMLFQPTTPVVQQSLSKSRLAENHTEAEKVAQTFLRAALIYGGVLVALGVFSREIAVFLLGREFSESGQVLAVLLVAVAFRIQASAGRTLISAAGERLSIMVPLVVLITAGAVAFAVVVPRAGLLGAAWVAACLAIGTALVSLRDGIRLLGLRYPWATLARVVAAMAATAGLGLWLRSFSFHVLVDLTLATLCYGAMLLLLREWSLKKGRRMALRKIFFSRIP
jgi:O-antigen/teichoic acid export membrane protein